MNLQMGRFREETEEGNLETRKSMISQLRKSAYKNRFSHMGRSAAGGASTYVGGQSVLIKRTMVRNTIN
tara:strand:+ start:231 stop:437 length:207 start_codon:yes stop_codon:yes gene_type:complete